MKKGPDDIRWTDVAVGILVGALLTVFGTITVSLCGCSSPSVSEPRYPEYDKWWTQSVNTNSLEGLGQGDVYVHEYVTTNLVLSVPGGDIRREVITNRMEAVLL